MLFPNSPLINFIKEFQVEKFQNAGSIFFFFKFPATPNFISEYIFQLSHTYNRHFIFGSRGYHLKIRHFDRLPAYLIFPLPHRFFHRFKFKYYPLYTYNLLPTLFLTAFLSTVCLIFLFIFISPFLPLTHFLFFPPLYSSDQLPFI